jgi:hypothetical protein
MNGRKLGAFLCAVAASSAVSVIAPAEDPGASAAPSSRGVPAIQTCASSSYGVPIRGTKRRPIATGDLTDDGKDDLLTLEYRAGTPNGWNPVAFVRARRGANGSLLWSVPVDISACELAADLTGDGISEVLIAETEVVPRTGIYIRTIRVLRGRDAGVLWSQTFRAVVHSAGMRSMDSKTGIFAHMPLNAAGLPSVVPDVTGDGLSDVFLPVYDAVWLTATREDETRFASAGRVSGLMLRGSDGAETKRASVPFAQTLPLLAPVPDLSGDHRTDVVDVEFSQSGTVGKALNADGTELWHVTLGPGYWMAEAVELTGDPFTDIAFVRRDVDDSGAGIADYRFVDGKTGKLLWRRGFPISELDSSVPETIVYAGQIDGIAGRDLLVALRRTAERMDVMALSGDTGSVIWGPVPFGPARKARWSFVKFCGCVSDLDGDGAFETLVMLDSETKDRLERRTIFIISGLNGAVSATLKWDSFDFPQPLGADVTGDRIDDFISAPWVAGSSPYRVRIHDGAQQLRVIAEDQLYRRSRGASVWGVVPGNLVGDKRFEVVYAVSSGNHSTRIFALGRRGVLWRV